MLTLSHTYIVWHWYWLSCDIFEFRKLFVLMFSEISFFLILFICWYYLTLTLTRFWHYLTKTLIRSCHCLIMTLSETDIDWVLIFFELRKFFFAFFFFFDIFLISKKIKETEKNLNKIMSCSLSKQWLIHQQLLSYWKATSKIYKKFDFEAKSSDLEKRLFNSASGIFMQYYMILSIVCFFLLVKTVSLLK